MCSCSHSCVQAFFHNVEDSEPVGATMLTTASAQRATALNELITVKFQSALESESKQN